MWGRAPAVWPLACLARRGCGWGASLASSMLLRAVPAHTYVASWWAPAEHCSLPAVQPPYGCLLLLLAWCPFTCLASEPRTRPSSKSLTMITIMLAGCPHTHMHTPLLLRSAGSKRTAPSCTTRTWKSLLHRRRRRSSSSSRWHTHQQLSLEPQEAVGLLHAAAACHQAGTWSWVWWGAPVWSLLLGGASPT